MSRRWMWSTLSSALLGLVGCAGTPGIRVDEARVAQLPTESKDELVSRQRSIDVAQSNLSSAKVAVDEAKQFRTVAVTEFGAARASQQAAEQAMAQHERSANPGGLEQVRRAFDQSNREVIAAQAKRDYADRLIDLRNA